MAINLNNSITNDKLSSKEKAKELAKKSPNLSDLIPYKIDDKTTIYFKPTVKSAVINKKLELYKKSLENVTGTILTPGD